MRHRAAGRLRRRAERAWVAAEARDADWSRVDGRITREALIESVAESARRQLDFWLQSRSFGLMDVVGLYCGHGIERREACRIMTHVLGVPVSQDRIPQHLEEALAELADQHPWLVELDPPIDAQWMPWVADLIDEHGLLVSVVGPASFDVAAAS
jgi:hypothetical protein